jgi:predicted nucleic acid-binding protein
MAAGTPRYSKAVSSGVAVSNTSPLIALYQIDRLDLLQALFDSVVVPPAVEREVAPSVGLLPAWVRRQQAPLLPEFAGDLHAGELEAIALAIHLAADFVIMDDLPGRRAAERLGLPIIGSLGLLVRAQDRGLIRAVRPIMDQMIANGLFVTVQLYQEILMAAGEVE